MYYFFFCMIMVMKLVEVCCCFVDFSDNWLDDFGIRVCYFIYFQKDEYDFIYFRFTYQIYCQFLVFFCFIVVFCKYRNEDNQDLRF